MEEEKEQDPKAYKNPLLNLLRLEWSYLGRRRRIFFAQLVLFIIAGLIGLLTPLVIGLIFNSIQQTISSPAELNKLIFMIFLLLAITIGFWMFHGIGRFLEQRTGFFVHRNYANSKMKRILELPVKWHKDHHSGDTIDKVNRGRTALSNFSQDMTYDVVYAVLNIFGSLIILFFVDVKIASFTLGFSLITLFIIMKVDKKLHKYYQEMNKFSNKLSSAVYDYLSNIITVITLRLKKTVSVEIDRRLMASSETHKKTTSLNEFKWGFASIAISLMTVLVLSYKAYTDYYSTGIIMIGTLYILYGYLSKVGNTFFTFAYLYGSMVHKNARVSGAYPIDKAFDEIKTTVGGKLPANWEEIEIKDIDFTYDKEGEIQHIDNVRLKFRRGQKIALVGESGSGKSTILALMRGLYTPEKGKIYCNREELKNGFEKLKSHVTLIPQDPEIFNNTLRYNITMDIPIKKEDIDDVVSMAQFENVVERLEKGLETNVLEKGVSLSGGEKQRLALARGLLAARKSEIVLLDEPTSSVDNLNEMNIYNKVFKEFKHKTILSSVHRLHLLKMFDYIYMFEKGKIVAEGTLEEIKKNPKFMYIWKKYGLTKEIK